MAPYIERHRPLLASHTEFIATARPPLPSITTRIEFTAERLAYRDGEDMNAPSTTVGGASGCEGSQGDDTSDPEDNTSTYVPRGRGSARQGAQKIPKPGGEPGRPKSGGFCVEQALVQTYKWSPATFDKLGKSIRREARQQLDMTVSFRAQDKDTIQAICDKMMDNEHWPELKNYEDCWPVRSILKLVLKYGSEKSRRESIRETNTRLRAALRGTSLMRRK